MTLTDSYVQIHGQLADVFKRISEGQAPDKFTRQHLKDLGFTSANFGAVIPLLKSLGFLAPDGAPTSRYHAYRDHSRSRTVLGEAIKEAYSDLFTLKANPTPADRGLIEGKFKSTHNSSENVAQRMASTFFALLSLADITQSQAKPEQAKPEIPTTSSRDVDVPTHPKESHLTATRPSLHYNIQIHLPATKDIEVFNAIFKSLKEHLLD